MMMMMMMMVIVMVEKELLSKVILPKEVVLLVKVIEHGVDVHKLQQPVPSLLLQIAINIDEY